MKIQKIDFPICQIVIFMVNGMENMSVNFQGHLTTLRYGESPIKALMTKKKVLFVEFGFEKSCTES